MEWESIITRKIGHLRFADDTVLIANSIDVAAEMLEKLYVYVKNV